MQKPIDGMYSTRSAITKPTGKNKFDAGINGITINAVPCMPHARTHIHRLYADEGHLPIQMEEKRERKQPKSTDSE